jgi:hypothetical protein
MARGRHDLPIKNGIQRQMRVLEAEKQKYKKIKIKRDTPSGSVVNELERSQCLKVKSGHTLVLT